MLTAKPPDFRRRALDLVTVGQLVAQVARGSGISDGTLRRWMAIDAVESGRVEELTSAEKLELITRPKKRVLKIENETLKQASAYFTRENILPK